MRGVTRAPRLPELPSRLHLQMLFCQACAEVSCYLLHRRIEDSFGECLLWELLRNICGDHRGDLGDALLSDHDAEQDVDEECENALGRFIEFFVLAVK